MKKLMTTQINLLKSKLGFTLVELMVVIAIIGILASIAVPQYNKFTSKARQSEAKVNLGGILTAEQAFYAENSFYTACLVNIGFSPGPGGAAGRLYNLGFNAGSINLSSSNANYNCGAMTDGVTFFAATGTLQPGQTAALTNTNAAPANFSAGAAGYISSTATTADEWTMTETGNLQNTTNASGL